MYSREDGKYFEKLHSKPWFFAGKVPELRYSYSASGLTPSLYPVHPRSVVPGSTERLARLQFKPFPNVDLPNTPIIFQEFREYQFLRDNETLVTVEHCDSCETHSSTTHHDPHQYSSLAHTLANTILARYPGVKVLLKPRSKLGFNSQRIGAFEVQVCSKSNGLPSKNTLHSKLQTKKWPDTQEIVMKLANFLPKCKLCVTVYDCENGENRLKDIKIFLRPKEISLQMSQTMRPKSASYSTFRPTSAISTMSLRTIKFSARRNVKTHMKSPRKDNGKCIEGVSNKDGICEFLNIPNNIYEIEVIENNEYNSATRIINTFEEAIQNSSINVFVGLKPRNLCKLTVTLRNQELKSDIPYAKVKIFKENGESYNLYEVSRGKYENSIPKGNYTLNAVLEEFQDISKPIQANKTEMTMIESMQLKEKRNVQIMTFNAITGEALGGVLLRLKTSKSKPSIEGLTKVGSFSYSLIETGIFNVTANKLGYLDASIITNITNKGNVSISIGLVPTSYADKTVIAFSWTLCSDDIEIQAFNDECSISYKSTRGKGCEFFDYLKSNGIATICVGNECKNLRILAQALTNEFIGGNESPMLNSGLSINVYRRNEQVKIIPSPGKGQWWDIGIVTETDFIEINILSDVKVLNWNQYIDDFSALIDLIKATGTVASCFNYTKYGIEKRNRNLEDKFISPVEFSKILSNIISEDALEYMIPSFITKQGISLNQLKRRYNRYKGIASPRLQISQTSIEEYAEIIGMSTADSDLLWIAEDAVNASLPDEWIPIHDHKWNIKYRNRENGDILDENPNNEYYRNLYSEYKVRMARERAQREQEAAEKLLEKERKMKELEEQKQRDLQALKERLGIAEWDQFIEEFKKECKELYELAEQKISSSPQEKENIEKETNDGILEKAKGYMGKLNEIREAVSDESTLESINRSIQIINQIHQEFLRSYPLEQGDIVPESHNEGIFEEYPIENAGHKKSNSSSSSSSSDN